MPTITAQQIISRAQTLLQDTTGVRWPSAELLNYLNDGQREICAIRPDISNKFSNVTLAAGTKQSLPADGIATIRVIRNMGSDGNTPGMAVRRVPMELLDSTLPNWHASTPAAVTLHYALDPRFPRTFYVYPAGIAGNKLETFYTASPADVLTATGVISIDDIYAGPLLDYTVFRAYLKDNELSANVERGNAHRQLFDAFMSGKAASDAVMSANATAVKG